MTLQLAVERYVDQRAPLPLDVQTLVSRHGTNALARVRYPDGTITVIKAYLDRRSAGIERAALELVAVSGGFLDEIPRVLGGTDDGETVVLEIEHLSGSAVELQHDAKGHVFAHQMGDLLRRLHRITPQTRVWGSLVDTRRQSERWDEYLIERARVRGAILQASGMLGEPEVLRICEAVTRYRAQLQSDTPCLVHADLNPTNLLQSDAGAPRLLDFERAFAGAGLYDCVKLFWTVFEDCAGCIHAFVDGYGRAEDLDRLLGVQALYRLVYSVDMAAYLTRHSRNDADRALLVKLLSFVRHAG